MESIVDKFLRYVSIDTQSCDDSSTQPSTLKQLDLQRMLLSELQLLGVSASLDSNGYLMASIPSNLEYEADTIGFIAHVDTSPDMSGCNVKPRMIYNYRGGDIVLNKERGIVLSTDTFLELNNYIGNTLITTDGTTLLGADDKAGIAAIMYAVEYMVNNPTMPHGKVCIAFTPDEEIGMGAAHFDVEGFGAKYAYTIDGGELGEIEYENFNAASASISIEGKNIHPGYAKDKMVNALLVAMDINVMLPSSQRPENTEGYEGFFHLTAMDGTVEQASMDYIIRDHSMEKFEEKKQLMTDVVLAVNEKYGTNVAKLELKDSYYNMKEKVMPHYHIVEKAVEAMELAGVEPKIKPIRGGTDGATLSFKGLPCPNIFAGGHNFHGKYEYIPVESMQKAAQVILNIISIYAKVGKE